MKSHYLLRKQFGWHRFFKHWASFEVVSIKITCFESILASSQHVKVWCFGSLVQLMWLYSQYFTQLDDFFTCDMRQRCLLLIKNRSEKLVWLSPTVFSGKGKNTVLGRQRADKVVLLRLGFIRGKCKGSRIVTASRSGPQSEKSATR